MVCEHLGELEQALKDAGVPETYRGSPWTKNCREWVYFDCILDLPSLRKRFSLDDVVEDHDLRGCHEGSERGFCCSLCHDGVMGLHPSSGPKRVFE